MYHFFFLFNVKISTIYVLQVTQLHTQSTKKNEATSYSYKPKYDLMISCADKLSKKSANVQDPSVRVMVGRVSQYEIEAYNGTQYLKPIWKSWFEKRRVQCFLVDRRQKRAREKS